MLKIYVPWLLVLLGFNSVFLILNGYFADLALGEPLRNASVSVAVFGFVPLAIGAWYFHNNHVLFSNSHYENDYHYFGNLST